MLLPKRAAEEKRRGGERARARSGVEPEQRDQSGGEERMGTGQGGGAQWVNSGVQTTITYFTQYLMEISVSMVSKGLV